MNFHVISAIFRRNFTSYFSSPTGYLFICVFVLASSVAAFWPSDFFNANLANLDQLNRWMPYILLGFIPAITMSIWADERRQGTDELLLTIPATDFDVVLGKYLAAVAIYAASLLFSFVSNYLVLLTLGDPDPGLLAGTYFGYFIVGMAMLAIGMAASFLTGNLTVGFILAVLLNLPLVIAVILPDWLHFLKRFSIAEQFRDFSRGVISFASIGYFMAIVAVMLYLSMVFIGRRHWRSGQGTQSMVVHYALRFLALVAVVFCASVFLSRRDKLRADVTWERLNSLAPQSVTLIKELNAPHKVVIESFVSPRVPESYVQTRLNLLATLGELQAIGGNKLQVIRHDVEPFSDDAERAEKEFGIKSREVQSRERGAIAREEVFLGLALTCGLEKVVLPFLDKGIPVEYELVRSIATVGQKSRKKIGVVNTDARLFGQFDMQTMGMRGNELVVEELRKQYEVVQVDASNPITEHFDVLLAVQPSSLSPEQMENLIAAIKGGQATAIFEDPFPWMAPEVPGTMAPKQPPGGNNPFAMQQGMRPEPKGDISRLWRVLGVDFNGDNVVWQNYNPMPKLQGLITPDWVFVDSGSGARPAFNAASPISSMLQQVLFLFPGSVKMLNSSQLKFTPLVSTNEQTGTVRQDQIIERSFMSQPRLNPNLQRLRRATNDAYVLAAHIQGTLKSDDKLMSDQTPGAELATEKADQPKEETDTLKDETDTLKADKPSEPVINVVVVSDIDCILGVFFRMREQGDDPEGEFEFNFDNVPFVLNVLDVLAGDENFVEIRTRRPKHRTLTKVNKATETARDAADKASEDFEKSFQNEQAKARQDFEAHIAKLKQREGLNPQQAMIEIMTAQQDGERKLETTTLRLKNERDAKIKQARSRMTREVAQVQDQYKFWAAFLPAIPPLLVALGVFFHRRAKEREGVSKARLR